MQVTREDVDRLLQIKRDPLLTDEEWAQVCEIYSHAIHPVGVASWILAMRRYAKDA